MWWLHHERDHHDDVAFLSSLLRSLGATRDTRVPLFVWCCVGALAWQIAALLATQDGAGRRLMDRVRTTVVSLQLTDHATLLWMWLGLQQPSKQAGSQIGRKAQINQAMTR